MISTTTITTITIISVAIVLSIVVGILFIVRHLDNKKEKR